MLKTSCRCCGSTNLKPYLDLGMMPLANNLCATKEEAINAERFELKVMFCEDCSFSQLSEVVDPAKLYSYYTYRSGVNNGYINHCKQMAIDLKERLNLHEFSTCIDIAGNDGTLLKQFKDLFNPCCVNVDPASNMKDYNSNENFIFINDFWSTNLVNSCIQYRYFKSDVITATNVFAHVDNLDDFLQAVKIALKPKGQLILEFPYLVDFINKNEFDTIYFEHLSYIALQPIHLLINKHGLYVHKVEKFDIHGGTIRVSVAHKENVLKSDGSLCDYLNKELQQDFRKYYKYLAFANDAKAVIEELKTNLPSAKVAAFAASAKGNTLLNACGFTDKQIKFIIDETPEKIGKYSPGTGIEIKPLAALTNDIDYLIILSWNFKDEIMDKCRKAGYTGKFIIPIPHYEVIV